MCNAPSSALAHAKAPSSTTRRAKQLDKNSSANITVRYISSSSSSSIALTHEAQILSKRAKVELPIAEDRGFEEKPKEVLIHKEGRLDSAQEVAVLSGQLSLGSTLGFASGVALRFVGRFAAVGVGCTFCIIQGFLAPG
ncbi:hypothetical protein AK812_SmicGene3915 [Symbiodinium microadriaticum]|uniref:Uncharacterized protein n=1 Tax=Symbiodinium microadriaticum TaxID=2951 RepID=A0A1Q9EXN2_SYMMI|nr:hypothetical protein AK812_SmicGene3915 [Symbiodinium microadriaticum]